MEQEKKALEVVLHQPEQTEATLETFKEFCSKVSYRLDDLTFEEKQKILRLLNIGGRINNKRVYLSGCIPSWESEKFDCRTFEPIQTGRYGICHITNSEPTTWFDFAQEIFRLSRMDIELVPIASDQFPTPARRPLNSVLAPYRLPQLLGREMRSWREAHKEYLRQRSTVRRAGV